MIQLSDSKQTRPVKAVGLLSGGLDSSLAARIVADLGVEVHGVYFSQPWGCCDKGKAQETATRLGIKFVPLTLDERYLEIIRNPKHGYGSALNPCRDCRIHMFARAGQYMRSIGADFIFTGEVVGQRPMSQLRNSLRLIERETGLEGRLLRPLSAQLLEPTIPEKEGLIDRTKLLALSGRGRKDQIRLAEEFGIKDFPVPAGGCSLTDKQFAVKMKDQLDHGYRSFRETIALKWGRHFRISPAFKIIVGKSEEQNNALVTYAHPEDYIFQLPAQDGPVTILKGDAPGEDMFAMAAGFVQRFSRYRNDDPVEVEFWQKKDKNTIRTIRSRSLTEEQLTQYRI